MAQKAARNAGPAPATKNKKQRIEALDLEDDELVRRAVELRSCEASGVTLHTLREVLRQLQSDISPAPVRDSQNSSLTSCSRAELASLLCFGAGEPTQLLTELKNAWERVKEPRPQHDQLQMRVVQWLWLWVRGCGVTNLGRLADLVSAAKEEDPIARDAPPNAPGNREKRPKEAWGQLEEIAEEAPGVLAGRLPAQPAAQPAAELGPPEGNYPLAIVCKRDVQCTRGYNHAGKCSRRPLLPEARKVLGAQSAAHAQPPARPAAELAAEPAVELGSPGGQFPLALLPTAGEGDEDDDEVEGASTQSCKICGRGASLANSQTCNRALPPAPAPAPSPYFY